MDKAYSHLHGVALPAHGTALNSYASAKGEENKLTVLLCRCAGGAGAGAGAGAAGGAGGARQRRKGGWAQIIWNTLFAKANKRYIYNKDAHDQTAYQYYHMKCPVDFYCVNN